MNELIPVALAIAAALGSLAWKNPDAYKNIFQPALGLLAFGFVSGLSYYLGYSDGATTPESHGHPPAIAGEISVVSLIEFIYCAGLRRLFNYKRKINTANRKRDDDGSHHEK